MSSRLTALRRARPGAVLLEVDGEPWRTVPDEVVARCGLAAGLELERPLLRRLRRELRHCEALAQAGRALRRRDLSRSRLAERLERAGVAPPAGRTALLALTKAGIVDDERLARNRADALAERGWGDLAIAARLEAEGVPEPEIRAALDSLPPESGRAREVVAHLDDSRKAWRLLARRGFDSETIEAAVGALDEGQGGGLG